MPFILNTTLKEWWHRCYILPTSGLARRHSILTHITFLLLCCLCIKWCSLNAGWPEGQGRSIQLTSVFFFWSHNIITYPKIELCALWGIEFSLDTNLDAKVNVIPQRALKNKTFELAHFTNGDVFMFHIKYGSPRQTPSAYPWCQQKLWWVVTMCIISDLPRGWLSLLFCFLACMLACTHT